MLKILLYVVAGLVALIAIALVVGLLLPKQHEAWKSMTFRATPAKVFAIVSDFAKYPDWRTGVTKMDVPAGDLRTGIVVTEHGPHGPIPYRIEVLDAPSKMVMRIADPNLGFGGTWTYEVSQNDSGSDLVITENGEVSNPFFRVMSKLFFSPTATIETYLADLKKRLGE